ncbi:MAG: YigZ family protein [Bacteroidales bacterium]|nr:YigZ family protein [Bacteroidales bacterium]
MEDKSKEFDAFNSIAAPSEGLFKDNGSRFIALAYPVETEEEIKAIVSSLKKEYHDARHHCYAYRLGYKADVFRANDDGEPSGSAGRPILGQIDSLGLSDVLVVVVRYFGGIKLGIPGLIRAYKTSTADALSAAAIVTKIATRRFRLSYDYLAMNSVMKVIKDLDLETSSPEFGLDCSLTAKVRLAKVDDFLSRVGDIDSCRCEEIEG